MRPLIAAAALLVAGTAIPTASWAAAPNDIIWDTPAPRSGEVSKETITPFGSGAGQPDKNGIIWDTPASTAPPKGAPSPAPSAAKPDANGIVWNAAPVKPASAPPSGPLLTPPRATSGGGRVAQAPPAADGPCREFQTTIVIDGKREPAHGTVCQQADGTWRVVNK